MLLGHFAVGLAAKRAAPRASLGALFLACQFLDVLWPILILTGVEHFRLVNGITASNPLDLYDMPWSHSALMSGAWSVLFAGVYFAISREGRAAVVLGAVVFSHWVTDFIAHRPDMQLTPWNPTRYGLGLWYSLPATIAVECGMFLVGAWLYRQATAPKKKTGVYVFLAILFLFGLSTWFTPIPSNPRLVAGFGLLLPPIALIAWWLDREKR
jgi:hypothetical protein